MPLLGVPEQNECDKIASIRRGRGPVCSGRRQMSQVGGQRSEVGDQISDIRSWPVRD
jgi:hypothetical protein